MRLIDADELYIDDTRYLEDTDEFVMFISEEQINNAPTVDAEVFVYCKDCTKWENEHICLQWSKYGTIETKETDFCSYGRSKW